MLMKCLSWMLKIASAKCIYCMQSLVRLALSVVYGFATRLQRSCQTPSFPPSSHPRLSSVRALIGICPWAVHHGRHHNKHTCSFPWHHPNAFLSDVPARTHAGIFHTRRTAIAVFSFCDFHLPRFIWLGFFYSASVWCWLFCVASRARGLEKQSNFNQWRFRLIESLCAWEFGLDISICALDRHFYDLRCSIHLFYQDVCTWEIEPTTFELVLQGLWKHCESISCSINIT